MRISLRDTAGPMQVLDGQLRAVDGALARLRDRDPELTRILELCLFAGMATERVAGAMRLSPRLTRERWREAKHRFLATLEAHR